MNPGDVRTFQKGRGNAVVVGVGVWAERKNDESYIQIHLSGVSDGHTTVTNNPGSVRYHRTLFRNLRRVLVTNDAWPYGDAGAETEEKE